MPARKDQPGRRARRACKACPALKDLRVPKGRRDRRVIQDQREIRAARERKGFLALLVPRAPPARKD